jgi:hypothetical protein
LSEINNEEAQESSNKNKIMYIEFKWYGQGGLEIC